ncbi:gluconolactonase [Mesorhizobium sp. L-8-10]|uniref:SMP-30/gluconolactonase/LRE family protein n=1 Tax=Mesorhizobium sp. L-8-10 TaxID=2744523 RepID=UPI001925DAD1|nr:SMP-30/gluconolactonase/LRE family protein [Mesorhizobium sp. L-8-10]BCH34514.1 gluconolactonase [Mesorhizobium sp. L-8-10]
MEPEALDADRNRLGECPVWCDRTQRLWWVDVLEPALWSHDPQERQCTRHPVVARRIGSLALRERGGLVLACDNGLFAYDPDTAGQAFLLDPEPGKRQHRKNDGRVDSAGNFWVGTLRESDYAPVGAIYRVTPELRVTMEEQDLAIPNSLAFDPERGRIFYADTRAYTIWVRDYDPVTGRAGRKRVFATTQAPARPDGSCVDAEGHLWNAEYAGGRLVRYAPSGTVSRVVDLPVSHPTCCCFGGNHLDRLYVTSASEPLSAEQQLSEPLAGRVLVLDAGVRGRPEFRTGL